MRILALDIGEKRTGIAMSDPTEAVAVPVCVLGTDEVLAASPRFREIIEDGEPGLILCGLPLSMDGGEHSQARRVREVAEQVAGTWGLPLEFSDERLSSAAAKRAMREAGLSEKQMRGKLDQAAATLFLQAWLDRQSGQQSSRQRQSGSRALEALTDVLQNHDNDQV